MYCIIIAQKDSRATHAPAPGVVPHTQHARTGPSLPAPTGHGYLRRACVSAPARRVRRARTYTHEPRAAGGSESFDKSC